MSKLDGHHFHTVSALEATVSFELEFLVHTSMELLD